MLLFFKRNNCCHTVYAQPAPLHSVVLSLPHMHFCVVPFWYPVCLRRPEPHMPRQHYTSLSLSPNLFTSVNPTATTLLFIHCKNNFVIFYYANFIVLVPLPLIPFSSLISEILISILENHWLTVSLNYKTQKQKYLQFLPVRSCEPCIYINSTNCMQCLHGPLLSLVPTFHSLIENPLLFSMILQNQQSSN